MRHAPQDRIVRREIAESVANAARDFEGALAVRVEDKAARATQAARFAFFAETLRLTLRMVGQQNARGGAGVV